MGPEARPGDAEATESNWAKTTTWVSDHGGPLVTAVGTVLLAGHAELNPTWRVNAHRWFSAQSAAFVIGALVSVVGLVLTDSVGRKARTYRNELDRSGATIADLGNQLDKARWKLDHLSSDVLRAVFRHLDLTNAERLTIYEYREEGFAFLSRYATNPKIRPARRAALPLDQGIVSEAWERGSAYLLLESSDVATPDTIRAAHVARGKVTEAVAAELRMLPTLIAAYRLHRRDDDQACAVFVLESTEVQKNKRERLLSAFKDLPGTAIGEAVLDTTVTVSNVATVGNVEYARREGF